MIILLPFPPRVLHPNARPHRMAKADAIKSYRAQAYWLTKAAGKIDPPEAPTIAITFHPPNRHRHDLDGMLSATKAALDGIADAIGTDDSKWKITLCKAEPVKGGAVKVEVLP